MEQDTVVVVGAGPAGLTVACALCSAGVAARVVDAATGPAATSRALGLQPRGVEVLDRLGALGDLPERSLRVNQVIVSVSGRELTRLQVGQRT
ncbi:MAG: FAD-dependent monooxygenase, partial [Acidobacteria bacterium]|nr:FAD-dependent monooxygenase [Acidobacteriota bacterium]